MSYSRLVWRRSILLVVAICGGLLLVRWQWSHQVAWPVQRGSSVATEVTALGSPPQLPNTRAKTDAGLTHFDPESEGTRISGRGADHCAEHADLLTNANRYESDPEIGRNLA